MSSPDDPRPEAENEEERSPAIDAEQARAAADDDLEQAASAGPGSQPTAADQGDLPAPGAPGELSSDDGEAGGGAATPDGEPAEVAAASEGDAGAPEPRDATTREPEAGQAAAPPAADPDAGVTPDQPPETDAVPPKEGVEAAAALQDKDSAAAEAAAANQAAEQPDEAVGEEPAEVDERRQALVDALREHLGDAVLETAIAPGTDIWARVSLESWQDTARVCRDKLGLTYFCFLSAIDWMPSPYGRGEESTESPGTTQSPKAAEPGVTGGDTRIQLLARLERPGAGLGVTLKADVPEGADVPTWTSVFLGAHWHERETHEMFGVGFAGHPNLAPLYLPSDFEGHPLRKDFPLLSRMVKPWPGLVDVEAMPGEPDAEEEEASAP